MPLSRGSRRIAALALALGTMGALAPAAHAQDFFSQLFGGLARGRLPVISAPFEDGPPVRAERPRMASGQAYCVRTCDGRYFPLSGSDSQSRASACNGFCPASKTEVVYGSNIDRATTESGKAYSELPNAFKYRSEIVPGCTCNGKDQFGLAKINVDEDPTLRKGDLVAGADGLKSVIRPDRRGAALDMTPVPASVTAKYERMPVVARD